MCAKHASHPFSTNGEWLSRVEILPPIEDWFLLTEELLVRVDKNLDNFTVYPTGTFVWRDGHVIVIEMAFWDLHLRQRKRT